MIPCTSLAKLPKSEHLCGYLMMDGEHLWMALHLTLTHLGPPDSLQGRIAKRYSY